MFTTMTIYVLGIFELNWLPHSYYCLVFFYCSSSRNVAVLLNLNHQSKQFISLEIRIHRSLLERKSSANFSGCVFVKVNFRTAKYENLIRISKWLEVMARSRKLKFVLNLVSAPNFLVPHRLANFITNYRINYCFDRVQSRKQTF